MLLLLLACTDSSDTGNTDTDTEADADTDADSDADTDADSDTDTDTDLPNKWGFNMRIPQTRDIDCNGTSTPLPDADWICEVDDGTVTYIRGTAVECIKTMSAIPIYDTVGEIWVDGTVASLEDVTYDWGGNHHNDSVRYTWGASDYTYYHSSFGFGWRSCQEMDCMQVANHGETVYVEDGCTCDRMLPIVCRQVGTDGTWGALEDTFAVCNGDSTCGG